MVEWLHWGRRSWNLFNMLYFEKNTNNKENLSGKMNVIKKYFFSLRSSNTSHSFIFNWQFFYELQHKSHHFSKSLCRISIFHSGFFTQVYLYFKGATNNYESVKKETFFKNWNLHHARLNSDDKAWSYKKMIKAQKG